LEKEPYYQVALMAIFTAIVFVFTSIFTIATPPTRGFFNFGEIGVYLSALIGGPIVGAVSGGLGSALADVFLGYAHYAPGTLVIKGIEGFIVGYLFRQFRKLTEANRKIVTLIISLSIFGFITFFGHAGIDVTIGSSGEENILGWNISVATFHLPGTSFIALAVILALIVFYLGWYKGLSGLMILACAVGGLEMVFGYFMYQVFVLNYGFINALAEIPVNITQMLIGLSIAVPVVNRLREMGAIAYSEESMV